MPHPDQASCVPWVLLISIRLGFSCCDPCGFCLTQGNVDVLRPLIVLATMHIVYFWWPQSIVVLWGIPPLHDGIWQVQVPSLTRKHSGWPLRGAGDWARTQLGAGWRWWCRCFGFGLCPPVGCATVCCRCPAIPVRYVDADFGGGWNTKISYDADNVMSRTGFVITYSNCPIYWAIHLQIEIALSTADAEYYLQCSFHYAKWYQ